MHHHIGVRRNNLNSNPLHTACVRPAGIMQPPINRHLSARFDPPLQVLTRGVYGDGVLRLLRLLGIDLFVPFPTREYSKPEWLTNRSRLHCTHLPDDAY